MRTGIVWAAFLLLTACALPQTTVRSGSSPPGLVVKGAPAGSILFVDGLQVGPAAQYDGNPKVLTVLEGVHTVEIRVGSNVVYSEKSLATSGETHTVTVIAGTGQ